MLKSHPADIPHSPNERGACFSSIPHRPHIPPLFSNKMIAGLELRRRKVNTQTKKGLLRFHLLKSSISTADRKITSFEDTVHMKSGPVRAVLQKQDANRGARVHSCQEKSLIISECPEETGQHPGGLDPGLEMFFHSKEPLNCKISYISYIMVIFSPQLFTLLIGHCCGGIFRFCGTLRSYNFYNN